MRMSYEKKKRLGGFLFTVPWLIGFVSFFLIPVIMSFRLSISSIEITDISYNLVFEGFGSYINTLTTDPDFVRTIITVTVQMVVTLAMVIFFSMFIAVILTQKFKGRLLVRAIFFLPVIVASGLVLSIINGDAFSQQMLRGQIDTSAFQITVLKNILVSANLSDQLVDTLMGFLNQIFGIVWKCGVQILIFMAGLQAIPISVKEASKIEGATGWEHFWKITFPMLTPILQLNIIYTIIDSFTDLQNPMIKMIYDLNNLLDFRQGSTIAWMYFLVIIIITGIAFAITNKKSAAYTD